MNIAILLFILIGICIWKFYIYPTIVKYKFIFFFISVVVILNKASTIQQFVMSNVKVP